MGVDRPPGGPAAGDVEGKLSGTVPEWRRFAEGLFAGSPVPLILFGADGHPVRTNVAYRAMFGAEPPPAYDLRHDELFTVLGLMPSVERAFAGERIESPPVWYDPQKLLHIVVPPEARPAAIACTFQPFVDDAGSVTHVLVAIRDVTAEWDARDRARRDEEARRAVEEEIRLARARFARIFESPMLGVIITTHDGRIHEANEAFLQMVGASREDAAKGRLRWDTLTPPEYAEADARATAELHAHGAFRPFEKEYLRRDGTRLPVLVSATQIPEIDANVAFVLDVSERKRLERRLLAVTDNATLGLLMMDERQRCVFMNPAAEAITGFRLDEVQGGSLHSYIHHLRPDGSPYPMEECPIDRALPTRNQQQGEDLFVRRDGTFYAVAFTASPIVEDGRAVGTVIELRDLTEEKRRQAEREQLLRDLQQAVRVRDEFLSVASHELKTPLTPLRMRLQALGTSAAQEPEGAFVERVKKAVSTSLRQVQRLTALVSDLLDVTRIAEGRFAMHPEPMDLSEAAADLAGRYLEEAEREGCTLRIDVEPGLVGRWDRLRVEQVLVNLLDNAIKYGAGKPVSLQVRKRGDRAEIVVTDQGIGIPSAQHGRIFGRFERAVSERHYGGLGLGLYITRSILRGMSGDIRVESTPGAGATFTVTLPLEAPTE